MPVDNLLGVHLPCQQLPAGCWMDEIWGGGGGGGAERGVQNVLSAHREARGRVH